MLHASLHWTNRWLDTQRNHCIPTYPKLLSQRIYSTRQTKSNNNNSDSSKKSNIKIHIRICLRASAKWPHNQVDPQEGGMGTIQLLPKTITPHQGGKRVSQNTLEQGTLECITGASKARQYCSVWKDLFSSQTRTRSSPAHKLYGIGHDGIWNDPDN